VTPERWREVTRIYAAVSAKAPSARGPALTEACGEDEELRREIESLLEENERSAVIDRPLAGVAITPVQIGSQIGVFRIDALLGVGGPASARAVTARELRRGLAVAQARMTRC
jgi:eukaryotic-like serine/threonine-protein kinase